MEPRRSTRIRTSTTRVTAGPAQPPNVARPSRKRKASGDDEKKQCLTQKTVAAKKSKVDISSHDKTNTKTKTNKKSASGETPDDRLSVLPAEILQIVLENVNDAPSMVKLACTSKRYYAIVMAVLHKRLSVSIRSWSHIPNLIRRLEPHLSIAQKKQLRNQSKHKYKGLQEEFSTHLDENTVPPCADFVRQMILGWVEPGKKHRPIVLRYWEEVLKNLHNLEVVEVNEVTQSISNSLAAQENLKALAIQPRIYYLKDEKWIIPLTKICNLQHLQIGDWTWGALMVNGETVIQSILLNSLSTLESLQLYAGRNHTSFMEDWEERVKARHPNTWKQTPDFTSLRSLSLTSITFSDKTMQGLTRAVDFLKLTELKIGSSESGELTCFKYLEDLFKKADKADIHLQKLSVLMGGGGMEESYAETEVKLEGIYRFISSFVSLICLDIHDYNQYDSAMQSDPGLSRRLQQSILKHKELETLRFHYMNVGETIRVPCVPAVTARILITDLPKLRVLKFAPSEDNREEIIRVLSGARNLTTLEFIDDDISRPVLDFQLNSLETILTETIKGFMGNDTCSGEFIWEEHYKLNKLTVGAFAYVIGSSLKWQKGLLRYKPIKVASGDCMVMAQNMRPSEKSSNYYIPSSRWMDGVAKPRYGGRNFMWDE